MLHGFSLSVEPGEVAVLLGLNGAGKSTAVKVLCGAVPVTSGEVRSTARTSPGWSTSNCVDGGIVMVPEGRRVFGDLTVERNLQVGSWTQRRNSAWVASSASTSYRVLPRLDERRKQLAGTLSGGEQQMLAIGRGLMANPAGADHRRGVARAGAGDRQGDPQIARELADQGTTVVLVEQNVGALAVADVGFFVDQGVVKTTLRGEELNDGERVRRLYMG